MQDKKLEWDYEQGFNSAFYHLETGVDFLKRSTSMGNLNSESIKQALEFFEIALSNMREADSLKRGFSFTETSDSNADSIPNFYKMMSTCKKKGVKAITTVQKLDDLIISEHKK